MSAVASATGEPISRLARMTPLTANALRKNPTSERAQENGRRFVRILREMARLLGGLKAANIWLREPHPELEGSSPLEALEAGYFKSVEGLVHDLATGAPG